MAVKTHLVKLFLFSVLAVVCMLFAHEKAFASNGTISTSPTGGNYQTGQSFQVAVIINGGGTAFNAAQATVNTSPTLQIQGVALGNCDFAFIKTPTQSNASFAGVILGGSIGSCTIYTLALQATEQGIGYVSFSNASIKQYKTAQEILSSTTDGRYTFLGSSTSDISITVIPTQPPIIGNDGVKYYSISYDTGISNSPAEVILDSGSINQKTETLSANSNTSSVTFENIPEGVHTLSTTSQGKEASKQIITVAGDNKNLVFGKGNSSSIPKWMWIVTAVAILIALAGIGYYLYNTYRRVKATI